MLGIIGAMEIEVEKLKQAMTNITITNKAGMDFYEGGLNGCPVVVVRCGIGKVNAAVCVQILVDVFNVDKIINTGVAGSLQAHIDIGDIVLSTEAIQHDMDVCALGYAPGQIPQISTLSFPASDELRKWARQCFEHLQLGIGIHEGLVLSGDQFIFEKSKKSWLVDTFGGCCAEMEGASIAQASWLNGVPFLIIRAISDKADDSAEMSYEQFAAQAVEHTVALLISLADCVGKKR